MTRRVVIVICASLVAMVGAAKTAKNAKNIKNTAASAMTAIGHVTPPRPAFDNAGNAIGYVDSNGRLIVNGRERPKVRVGQDGSLTDGKGRRIGFVPSGNDEVVGEPGKKRVLTTGPEGACVIPAKNPLNQRMLEPGESIPVCGKTVEEVMQSVQVMFGQACKAGVEQILYVVRKPNGRYELRRGDFGDGTAENATFRPRLRKGEIIVGIIHDHPAKGSEALWPSEWDVITALKYKTNIYVHDCQSDKMSVAYLKTDERYWKQVRMVENGVPTKKLEMPPRGDYCNGYDPYDEAQYERYAVGKFSQVCGDHPAAKTQKLGSVRSSDAGGYCQCAQPYLYGEHVRTSRSHGKIQHWGVVGFVCGKCCKIEKAMYAKAQELKAKQSGEGVPTFWMDIQLQVVEDMREKTDSLPEAERRKMAEAMFKSLQSADGSQR